MELIYKNKKTTKDIIQKAETKPQLKFDDDGSLLLFGDNFDGLSSLFNGYRGKIDLIYIDPPFNTNQTFVVSNDRRNSISKANNALIAYSDDMSREDYLEFIRERLILMKELLSEKGSIYLHIDTKVGHYIKVIMDEVFGEENYKNDITRIKSNPKNFSRKAYGNEKDVIYFYAKNGKKNIWNEIRIPIDDDEEIAKRFPKIDENGRRYTTIPLHAPGETSGGVTGQPWRGMKPPSGRHWRTNPAEFDRLDSLGLIEWSSKGNPRIKKFADEHGGKKIQDVWVFKDPQYPLYPTEKNIDMLEMIIKQSSLPESIVMDCFCGSGSTLLAAANLGRRWIGMDASETAIETVKSRQGLTNYTFIDLKAK